jgi:hypothetical protein
LRSDVCLSVCLGGYSLWIRGGRIDGWVGVVVMVVGYCCCFVYGMSGCLGEGGSYLLQDAGARAWMSLFCGGWGWFWYARVGVVI